MFQPETEDMLPRMAPKPSGTTPMGGATEPIIRPQVPEVSILFGQQGGNLQTQSQPDQQAQQTTSYAAWKKQMLPKVTFPAAMAHEIPADRDPLSNNNNNNHMQEFNTPRCNLYPMRSVGTAVAPMSANGNGNGYMDNRAPFASGNDNQNGYAGVSNPSSYRQNLENCGMYQSSQQQQQQQQQQNYRKSVEMTPPPIQSYNSPRDVLTICAGTQTDGITSPGNGQQNVPSNLASKEDVEDIKRIVQEIRHNQLCLMQMMEKFICSQQLTKARVECKDAAIQVDSEVKESVPMANGFRPDLGQNPLPAPTNKFLQQVKQSPNILQTPKGKPMAQSTAYRPNTPQSNRLQEYQQVAPNSPPVQTQPTTNYQQWNNQMALALPKASTDKSMVMNELALKYLPNEKLAELLKELNVACPLPQTEKHLVDPTTNCSTTPLRNMDNFERAPSDISNASYKYLKKYRLLPEDNIEDGENENPLACNTTPHQQYGTTRSSPGQQRQTQPQAFVHQKPNSPYQQQQMGRLPQSPLARAGTTPMLRNNMLDLENIKHQPKFL